VFKVWIEEKYQTNVDWIEQALKQNNYDTICFAILTFLGNPTHLREHPNPEDRQRLFKRYQELLQQDGTPFSIISGLGDTRLKKSVEIIDAFIK
jgi:nicotinamide riboside kinase